MISNGGCYATNDSGMKKIGKDLERKKRLFHGLEFDCAQKVLSKTSFSTREFEHS